MINKFRKLFEGLHTFLILWATQGLSALGSSMTSYALVIWSYEQHGSALASALLTVCSYAPYVLLSIFAGALSDRWNKKATMLICDSFAAFCTLSVLTLLVTGRLELWHLSTTRHCPPCCSPGAEAARLRWRLSIHTPAWQMSLEVQSSHSSRLRKTG